PLTLPPALLVLWHWRRNPATQVRFVLRFALGIAAGVALLLPLHGWVWWVDALRALFTHGGTRASFVRGPAELLRYLGSFAELAIVAVLGAVWLASRGSKAAGTAPGQGGPAGGSRAAVAG